ncbi:MAG TPA: sugar ABC transporter permease [Chloroflexota bacterium]|jgi:multiple sugar transport system permease protein|nr:sugar ABC transporter permease [Chloroflexota bacterium]
MPEPRATPFVARLAGVSSGMQARDALWGYVFLLPWIVGLIVFFLGPIILSFALSFTQYDVISPPIFNGLENYHKAFFDDELFWPSILRTFKYSAIVVPVGLLGALGLALLLNRGIKGTNIFRASFFVPTLTPSVALVLLWGWLLQPEIGPVNLVLKVVGIEGPAWLQSQYWAFPSIVIINLWASMGGNTMLIFLAGLQGVPHELYEAASLDGAGGWARFRHVTLPMISPTFFFNLVLGVIGALKVFTTAFVATQGGPAYSTWFFALHIYQQAFAFFKMGYGSALAWVFVVVLLIFTYTQLVLSRRWVYYAGGE